MWEGTSRWRLNEYCPPFQPLAAMPSSHNCLKLTYQVFVKCIISSRVYISAYACHYLPQCTFCTCKSINLAFFYLLGWDVHKRLSPVNCVGKRDAP